MEDTEVVVNDTTTASESPAEKKKSPPDHIPSQRQLKHLEYARGMKKLKQEQKNHVEEVQNRNLDFIYKRLTNIEKSVAAIAEEQYVPPVGSKRRKRKSTKSEESTDKSESSKTRKSRKIKKTSEEIDNPVAQSSFFETYLPYAGKAMMVGGSAFIISLLKNTFLAGNARTTDGDTINGYVIDRTA